MMWPSVGHSYSFLFAVAFILTACNEPGQSSRQTSPTTTSTENSGLLAILNPVFEQKYNAKVDVIAVGTGKALKIGSHGDVDLVLVHAPAAELKYVKQGDLKGAKEEILNTSSNLFDDYPGLKKRRQKEYKMFG